MPLFCTEVDKRNCSLYPNGRQGNTKNKAGKKLVSFTLHAIFMSSVVNR